MISIDIKLLDDKVIGDKIFTLGDILMVNLLKNSGRLNAYLNSCLYILLGPKKDRRTIYVGLTKNIANRLKLHKKKKEWWEECLFFINLNKQFTRTETEWLEREMMLTFINSNLYDTLTNYLVPNQVIINDLDQFLINEAFSTIKLLLNIFGCPIYDKNDAWVNSKENISSLTLVSRIVKSYLMQYLPEEQYVDQEDAHIIQYNNAIYFDIGDGRILICKDSEVYGDYIEYDDKVIENIVVKDILVENEEKAKLIIGD